MSSKPDVELSVSPLPLPPQDSSPASEGDKKATQDHKSLLTADDFFLDGLIWYAKAHYSWAMKLFQWAVERSPKGESHVGACLHISYMCKHGKGIAADKEKAYEWEVKARSQLEALQKRAATGAIMAQFNLGYYYESVTQEYEKAIACYEKIKDDSIFALHRLGYLYGRKGKCYNATKAIACYTKAAEEGHPTARFNLSVCYKRGKHGLRVCDETAEKWLLDAADQDHAIALYNLGIRCAKNKDYQQAFKYSLSAYKAKYKKAAYNIAVCYANGWGVGKNVKENYATSQYFFGLHYDEYYGVGHNAERALQHYKNAAEGGNADARYQMVFFLKDSKDERDLIQAEKYLRAAAAQKHPGAMELLQRMTAGDAGPSTNNSASSAQNSMVNSSPAVSQNEKSTVDASCRFLPPVTPRKNSETPSEQKTATEEVPPPSTINSTPKHQTPEAGVPEQDGGGMSLS